MARIVLFNKPFNVLCQFTDAGSNRPTLADFIAVKNIYAAGRLDRDSEGLVLLTDDGALQHRLTDPRHKLAKTYLVQVEGVPSVQALEQLQRGVFLNDGVTLPAHVELIADEPLLWPRIPPIRVRAAIPTCWLKITVHEGRNRQIRRMTAAVGFPTLRLIRLRIGDYTLGELRPGQWLDYLCAPNLR